VPLCAQVIASTTADTWRLFNYAEAGDFASAIHWEKTALQDATFNAHMGAEALVRLQLYEAGQAYHQKQNGATKHRARALPHCLRASFSSN
jgi:hypothetical protein